MGRHDDWRYIVDGGDHRNPADREHAGGRGKEQISMSAGCRTANAAQSPPNILLKQWRPQQFKPFARLQQHGVIGIISRRKEAKFYIGTRGSQLLELRK